MSIFSHTTSKMHTFYSLLTSGCFTDHLNHFKFDIDIVFTVCLMLNMRYLHVRSTVILSVHRK